MSLVYLTYHNENVHDFDQVDDVEKRPKLKYTSKYNGKIKNEAKQPSVIVSADGIKMLTASGKYEHRTMGYERTPLNAPSEFMRKNHGVKWLRKHNHVCPRDSKLPSLPCRPRTSTMAINPLPCCEDCAQNSNCPIIGNKKAYINFIALNIDRVKQTQPKKPNPRYVDTPQGDRHDLIKAGLMPQFVFSKNFGKIPCYLRRNQNVAQQLHKVCTKESKNIYNRDYSDMFGTRKLTNVERESILEGLKTNFIEQSKIFQRLSLYTDTIAKKLRKTRIENSLRQLEQDIYLMEKNPVIYVSNY